MVLKFLRIFCAFALLGASCFAGDKKCEEMVMDDPYDNMTWGDTCFYPLQTIAQAHADFRESKMKESPDDPGYKNLRSKLEIGKKYKYGSLEKERVVIDYAWDDDKTLNVEMFYSGGITTVKFVQEDNGTRMSVIYSAD
ncbi:MAG: hypothetical protein LBQ52_07660 [Helicobacteraceae bacterium]|jgi:hypothetical protein|nr:hypothetical protein [Helicobacteraceae bacterium]